MNNVSILVHPTASIKHPDYEPESIQNFATSNKLYDNIFIGNGLGHLNSNIIPNFLVQCFNKLNKNGKVIIHDLDLGIVSHRISIGAINIQDANLILAGKQSYHSIYSLTDFFSQMPGVKILSKKIENIEFTLEIAKL